MTELIPTARLEIVWPEGVERLTDEAGAYALERIYEFADQLVAEGKRPWFEILYPPHRIPGSTLTDEELLAKREEHFDAIEVLDNGEIRTVPRYADLLKGATP